RSVSVGGATGAHATADWRRPLGRARRLLAPGGLLLLLEGTTPRRWLDLVFGLTAGWWRFRDVDVRPAHPLLSGPQWVDVLHTCGFREALCLGCEPVHQTLIVAQADASSPADQADTLGHWLVLADAEGTGRHLGALLTARGATCTLVYAGTDYAQMAADVWTIDPCRSEHYQRLLAAIGVERVRGCVHLWGVDAVASEADAVASEADTAAQLGRSQLSWESTLHLAQALVRGRCVDPPRLVLVTRGAGSVSGDAVPRLAASPVWGLG